LSELPGQILFGDNGFAVNPASRPAGQFLGRHRRTLDDRGDLVERHREHIVQHERDSLGGTQCRRNAALAGSPLAAGVAASQARPASHTRTAAQRRRMVKRHVERARADHERLASIRARVFPTTAVTGKQFDASAARREARRLTAGHRQQVKRARRKR
jgi:hypothetical protein